MWLFGSNYFLSVVADRDNASNLLVRARFDGDLERALGDAIKAEGARVIRTPRADYLYRVSISREAVAKVIAGQIGRIRYDNFKDSVGAKWRVGSLMDIWTVMWRAQRDREEGIFGRRAYGWLADDDEARQ